MVVSALEAYVENKGRKRIRN